MDDENMGHGIFVPVVAAYIIWQKRDALLALKPRTNWWGLALILWGLLQGLVGTLGAELFLQRTAFVFALIGVILLLGGTAIVRALAFPLFLLFFMIPIPSVIFNQITVPLQLLASRVGEEALMAIGIPVLREGNLLILPSQTLSVVEACSGIRSLLSLTFLALVYGWFFESNLWLRVVLFFASVPTAIVANAGRVTLTGVLSEYDKELAQGFFHHVEGWVIFVISLAMLILVHWLLRGALRMVRRPR
jgi:exosortase